MAATTNEALRAALGLERSEILILRQTHPSQKVNIHILLLLLPRKNHDLDQPLFTKAHLPEIVEFGPHIIIILVISPSATHTTYTTLEITQRGVFLISTNDIDSIDGIALQQQQQRILGIVILQPFRNYTYYWYYYYYFDPRWFLYSYCYCSFNCFILNWLRCYSYPYHFNFNFNLKPTCIR
ncbi:uncharacterized protein C8R40DRAFT_823517 [Lentinula edodes]|uniref:uncharacterized protein n=1 Tax=Lentinula edodes TaxID=5353 RepID=UPI001E8EC89E|nr:uncharacterized protein C8R40DRAFT_823517 [Lentinula edodes]KAH7868553.1 hypothetical protein C8R40DRAFT_823517 [Lentinula edodes]